MLNYIFYCLTNLCFVKKTGNEKAPFRLVFDITAQSTCLYDVNALPLRRKIILKIQLVENKEATLLMQLNW